MDQTTRIIPCVLLATNRRKENELSEADHEKFVDALHALELGFGDQRFAKALNLTENIDLRDPNDTDGGNGSGGGGGGPARPALSKDGYCFWDFRSYPGDHLYNNPAYDKSERYPLDLRFELCIRFDSFASAIVFVGQNALGSRLKWLYEHVLIVPYFEHPGA